MREQIFSALADARYTFDVIVIGGGATGAGVAWDAAGRGLTTLLLEAEDFAQGTSSRSTKLIHGGVRYLAQGQLGLVREALRERHWLLANAASLVRPLNLIIPTHHCAEFAKYRLGLGLYDWLAGPRHLAPATSVEARAAAPLRPYLQPSIARLLRYADAQFDDCRLLLAVLSRAVHHGAYVLNYAPVQALLKHAGQVCGVAFKDAESGRSFEVKARTVINAAGPRVAALAALDSPSEAPTLSLSRGSHVVVGREFWPFDDGLLIPKTSDGRVLFVLPWQGHTLLGTTDVAATVEEPVRPTAYEVALILDTAANYLAKPPRAADVIACFAGVRPLAGGGGATSRLSREYQLASSSSGLISIFGGKWTTFRPMARACVDLAVRTAKLSAGRSLTHQDRLLTEISLRPRENRAVAIPASATLVTGMNYTEGEARQAVRFEMARTVEDILARRCRALFVNAAAAVAAAPRVAQLLAEELGRDAAWETAALSAFQTGAAAYHWPYQHPNP